jgi:predicted acetyltransferase
MFTTERAYDVRPIDTDDELSRLIAILCDTFNIPDERAPTFIDRVGRENFRIVTSDEHIPGGLALVPMGQFFGGRSVPMTGIVAVGIEPAFRGRGAGTALMKQTVRELHEQRVPLSTLYPATQPIYRAAGYEQCGNHFQVTLPLERIRLRDRSLDVRLVEERDLEIVHDLYRRDAMRSTGPLDRGPYIWERVYERRGMKATGYLVERDGTAEGYIYYGRSETGAHMPAYNLGVTDLVALTSDAGRRIYSMLADHQSMAGEATFSRSVSDPLLALLPEQSYQIHLTLHWMLRIVDVEAALSKRGYSPGVRGAVHFNVNDDLIESNNGRFMLEVDGGGGTVTRGGEGTLDIDIRGLSMLYTGHRSPRQLLATHHLRASEDDAAAAGAIFAGTDPWMADMF